MVIGLAGIAASFCDDAAFAQGLSNQEAHLAVRYAVNEMDAYPDWLSSLLPTHEHDVACVLNECVQGEWNYPADREQVHDVISRFSWEGGDLAKLVRQTVLACLSAGDPTNRRVLDDALSLLLKTVEMPATGLGGTALARCRSVNVDSDAFAIWAAVGLGLEADATLAVLEDRLADSALADRVWLEVCGVLGGDLRTRVPTVATPDFCRATSMRRMIPLVFRHLRPEDDINRGRGVYTPTAPDEAQRFRDGLVSRLAESDSSGRHRSTTPFARRRGDLVPPRLDSSPHRQAHP